LRTDIFSAENPAIPIRKLLEASPLRLLSAISLIWDIFSGKAQFAGFRALKIVDFSRQLRKTG